MVRREHTAGRYLHGLLGAFVVAAVAGAQAAGNLQGLRMYTQQEVHETPISVFFGLLGNERAGYHPIAAYRALIKRALESDPPTREEILQTAARYVEDPGFSIATRSGACYTVAGIEDDRTIPFLTGLMTGNTDPTIRAVAANALGVMKLPEARAAVEEAAKRETHPFARDRIAVALSYSKNAVAELPENQVRFHLVKDWMRIRNAGEALEEVEFQRYFPVVDEEQLVLGRWVDAQTSAGQPLEVSLVRVAPGSGGNLIHTYHLGAFPAMQEVVVTVTAVVARHDRPPPTGEYPIPAPEQYPADVRPYLQTTPMVAADHADVVSLAKLLVLDSKDAYKVTTALCERLHALPFQPSSPNWATEWDGGKGLPIAAVVLKYGHVYNPSAVCAAAVLRACGIPAQLTYVPGGEIRGTVQAYLNGYGWYRIESVCGGARIPKHGYGAPCLLNMPVAMESYNQAFMWPYVSSQESGPYEFRAKGEVCPTLTYTVAAGQDGKPSHSYTPFRHMETGSGYARLGLDSRPYGCPYAGAWTEWDTLAEALRTAVGDLTIGPFEALVQRVPEASEYIQQGLNYVPPTDGT